MQLLSCRLATLLDTLTLHRGLVASLAPGWKAAALPLVSTNDDPTPPFPLAASAPGLHDDTSSPIEPLILYRLLGASDLPTGNRLRLVKLAGGNRIAY